jgi:hypothetical protein
VSEPVVNLSTLLCGYREALERFHAARLGQDPATAYLPLFGALNWVASIDEGLRYPDHRDLRGLRFARHRVHHQWADALYVREGAAFPATFPMAFFEWRWRRELPAGRNNRDKPAYLQHLADQPARLTLDAVADFFDALQ